MKIVNKNICVVCPTEKLYLKAITKALKEGGAFTSPEDSKGVSWSEYGKETTIAFVNGIFARSNKDYYQTSESHLEMITASQYLNNKELIDKFIVSWEEKDCGDPQERFVTFTEAKKKAKELGKDENVVNDSIDIVEIKNRWQISPIITIKKVKEGR